MAWYGFWRKRQDLEEQCRQAIIELGIDGRTSYFAGALLQKPSFKRLPASFRLSSKQIEKLLRHFLSDRYADFFMRRARGLENDIQPMNLILSQGYKRGLRWRNIPLGKTCYDVSIYQQMIQDIQPRTVIEFGTGLGASALFFSDCCRIFGLETRIITLDRNRDDVNEKIFANEAIEFIAGDIQHVGDLLPANRLRTMPHPWLIIEDCHNHIPLIVEYVYPLMAIGDYLVIEDVGNNRSRTNEIREALRRVPQASLMVDTFYTDLFGRNATCSPDSIFRKMV